MNNRRKARKSLLSFLLAFAMVLSLMPAMSVAVLADNTTRYVKWIIDPSTDKITGAEDPMPEATCVVLNGGSTSWGSTGNESWYVVNESLTISTRIEVAGNVNLILPDDVTLTIPKGIHVPDGATLIIYGQESQTGKLIIGSENNNTVDDYKAGIGGNFEEKSGTITINGGDIEVHGGRQAAGIGGGGARIADFSIDFPNMAGETNINGGKVRVYGGAGIGTANGGAGIGGGNNAIGTNWSGNGPDNGSGDIITIRGGDVYAEGGDDAAGIGGGCDGSGGRIIITGGEVEAKGKSVGSGIGGGDRGSGGVITLTGGKITATGGTSSNNKGNIGGAGIGGGDNRNGGYVYIGGDAEIIATGGANAAGIGGGRSGGSGTIIIEGGYVKAVGTDGGAGIGSGRASDQDGTITISGGAVIAEGGSDGGAGIGSGKEGAFGAGGDGGTIVISGGAVQAHGQGGGAGIGGGAGGNGGNVTIRNNAAVYAKADTTTGSALNPSHVTAHTIGRGDRATNDGSDGSFNYGSGMVYAKKTDYRQYLLTGQNPPENTYDFIVGNPVTDNSLTLTPSSIDMFVGDSASLTANLNSAHDWTQEMAQYYDWFSANNAPLQIEGAATWIMTNASIVGFHDKEDLSDTAFDISTKKDLEKVYLEGVAPGTGDVMVTSIAKKADGTAISATCNVTVRSQLILAGASANFNDRIELNYYFEDPLYDLPTGAKVVFENDDKREGTGYARDFGSVFFDDGDNNSNSDYWIFTLPLYANEAANTISLKVSYTVNDETKYIPISVRENGTPSAPELSFEYRLVDYLDGLSTAQGNNSTYWNELALAAKDYCYQAQQYFEYRTPELDSVFGTTRDLTNVDLGVLSAYDINVTGQLPSGVSYVGLTLMIQSDNTLRVYYKDPNNQIDNYSISSYTGDKEILHAKSNAPGYKYLALPDGTSPDELDVVHNYTIGDHTVTASGLTYIYRTHNNTNVNNLGKALYKYYLAAKDITVNGLWNSSL